MPDDPTPTPDVPASVPAPPPPVTGDPDAGAKKALEAERTARKAAEKAANAAAARLKELEDRDKTEAERIAERATAAERRADEAEARALRLEVAQAKGLSAAQAKRLQGNTREELEADADDLLETFKVPDPPNRPPPGGKPTEHLRGGGDPTVPLGSDPLERMLRQRLGIT